MNVMNVYYEVVLDKFFVRYVTASVLGVTDKEDKVFIDCAELVDYYRDKFGNKCEINFIMINYNK